MYLLEKNIPYKSIIMRCDSINGEAYSEVSEFFSIENYHDGMETIWADIQKMSRNIKWTFEINYYRTQVHCQKKQ